MNGVENGERKEDALGVKDLRLLDGSTIGWVLKNFTSLLRLLLSLSFEKRIAFSALSAFSVIPSLMTTLVSSVQFKLFFSIYFCTQPFPPVAC